MANIKKGWENLKDTQLQSSCKEISGLGVWNHIVKYSWRSMIYVSNVSEVSIIYRVSCWEYSDGSQGAYKQL